MYRIINIADGKELGAVDHVTYIKVGSSGSYIFAGQEDAVGVALNGTPYNLVGHDEIQDADTVIVSEFDGGALVGFYPKQYHLLLFYPNVETVR